MEQSLLPDLVKFHPFGKTFQLFDNVLRVNLAKILDLLWLKKNLPLRHYLSFPDPDKSPQNFKAVGIIG